MHQPVSKSDGMRVRVVGGWWWPGGKGGKPAGALWEGAGRVLGMCSVKMTKRNQRTEPRKYMGSVQTVDRLSSPAPLAPLLGVPARQLLLQVLTQTPGLPRILSQSQRGKGVFVFLILARLAQRNTLDAGFSVLEVGRC